MHAFWSRVTFRRVLHDTRQLADLINASGFAPQALVAINRSGAITGAVLCGIVEGLDSRAPLVVGLNPERDNGVRTTTISGGLPDLSNFHRVVVTSCVNDSGHGLQTVLDWIRATAPTIETRTAAVYSSERATVIPDFVGRIIEADRGLSASKLMTRMPWMIEGWHHDLLPERSR
jgi:hypoxanthine phosphoribosyltransferase